LDTDGDGNFKIVGDPEGDVYPRHLREQIAGLPDGEEKNPLRRSVMYGNVFVIDGAVPDVAGNPIKCRMPNPENIADLVYDKHTRFLERLKTTDSPASQVERQDANDAVRIEGKRFLEMHPRQMTRSLRPRINNVNGEKNRAALLTLLSYMHYREMDREPIRKTVMEFLREGIKTLDPNRSFMLTVEDDD